MGTTLAQAYVQVIPTTKGIKGMLGKELGNEGDSGGKTTGMKFTGAFKKQLRRRASEPSLQSPSARVRSWSSPSAA